MSQRQEAQRAPESHRPDTNTGTDTADRVLQEITRDDMRAFNARVGAERERNANNPALPNLEICHSPDGNFAQNIQGAQFDRNHDGSISREELRQTFEDPAVRRSNQCTSATAFALYDNFNQVTRLHDDRFNGDITEGDLTMLRRSPTDALAARAINAEISAINSMGLDQVIAVRRAFPAPEGP